LGTIRREDKDSIGAERRQRRQRERKKRTRNLTSYGLLSMAGGLL
jgi:hypothetical protein